MATGNDENPNEIPLNEEARQGSISSRKLARSDKSDKGLMQVGYMGRKRRHTTKAAVTFPIEILLISCCSYPCTGLKHFRAGLGIC